MRSAVTRSLSSSVLSTSNRNTTGEPDIIACLRPAFRCMAPPGVGPTPSSRTSPTARRWPETRQRGRPNAHAIDPAEVGVDVEAPISDEAEQRSFRSRGPGRPPGSTGRRRPPSTGTPAIAAFCTSSKLTLPLTRNDPVRQRNAPGEQLGLRSGFSRALCRPTSSRSFQEDGRAGSNRPDA